MSAGAVDVGADEFKSLYPTAEEPHVNLPHVVDSDGDGIPDDWETANGLDPEVPDSPEDLQGYLDSVAAASALEIHTPLQ